LDIGLENERLAAKRTWRMEWQNDNDWWCLETNKIHRVCVNVSRLQFPFIGSIKYSILRATENRNKLINFPDKFDSAANRKMHMKARAKWKLIGWYRFRMSCCAGTRVTRWAHHTRELISMVPYRWLFMLMIYYLRLFTSVK